MADAESKTRDNIDILQIISAVGWKAVYNDHTERVSCWALIEYDNSVGGREREVVGMVNGSEGFVQMAFDTPHFGRYVYAPA